MGLGAAVGAGVFVGTTLGAIFGVGVAIGLEQAARININAIEMIATENF